MNDYIATFFTHHDAIVYQRELSNKDLAARMMPVPRKLSSSCGTCVSFQAESQQLQLLDNDNTEMVVSVDNGSDRLLARGRVVHSTMSVGLFKVGVQFVV